MHFSFILKYKGYVFLIIKRWFICSGCMFLSVGETALHRGRHLRETALHRRIESKNTRKITTNQRDSRCETIFHNRCRVYSCLKTAIIAGIRRESNPDPIASKEQWDRGSILERPLPMSDVFG